MNWYKTAQAYDGTIDGIPYKHYGNNIAVINIINLLDVLEMYMQDKNDYEEQSKLVKRWADQHNAHYYSRPKDKLFISEAIDEAKRENKSVVVIEDLS